MANVVAVSFDVHLGDAKVINLSFKLVQLIDPKSSRYHLGALHNATISTCAIMASETQLLIPLHVSYIRGLGDVSNFIMKKILLTNRISDRIKMT
jgi:hypothetical protein